MYKICETELMMNNTEFLLFFRRILLGPSFGGRHIIGQEKFCVQRTRFIFGQEMVVINNNVIRYFTGSIEVGILIV